MSAAVPRIERDVQQLKAEVGERPLPRHVGIIMDGNGRWAEQRGLPRLEGHRKGSDSVREVTRAARRLGATQAVDCLVVEDRSEMLADPEEPSRISEDTNIGETGDIPAGRYSGLALDLAPGVYTVICNELGHFGAGMHLTLVILPAPGGDE